MMPIRFRFSVQPVRARGVLISIGFTQAYSARGQHRVGPELTLGELGFGSTTPSAVTAIVLPSPVAIWRCQRSAAPRLA